jgi:GNAT superfamily N-acetyltransferase
MSEMNVNMRMAETRAEVLRCRNLIAEVYNRQYGVVFSSDSYDLEAKIEPWPHRYLIGTSRRDLVCTAGLYLHDTYVERFGGVSPGEIDAELDRLGAAGHSSQRLREITKVVVAPDYRGRGVARILLAAAHSRAFLQQDATEPYAVVSCAKLSIYRHIFEPVVTMHRLKAFPVYRVHEHYRSAEDPMESRIVAPSLDVPARYYEHALPGSYDLRSETLMTG